MQKKINITIWNEYLHELQSEEVGKVYPNGIHNALADYLKEQPSSGIVRTATLEQPSHGLTDDVLESTDVMLWWGHMAHDRVDDNIVNKVYSRVMAGMGLIVLHSAHASKIFGKLCGTEANKLKWRADGELERLWIIDNNHPIVRGLSEYIEIPHEEMYGEKFHIPEPDELIFISWFEKGEVFRSGCTFKRGNGKVFYFRPGHETFPVYHQPEILKVIGNAVEWACPVQYPEIVTDLVDPL